VAKQVAVGPDLYLFHGDAGRSEFLCISAHGETLRSFFTVPAGVSLFYYAPRDHVLQMHANFRLGIRVEEQILAGDISPDYELSKFQGAARGGGKETYETIMGGIDKTRGEIGEGVMTRDQYNAANPALKILSAKMQDDYFKAHVHSKENLLPMDVLTIRARGLRKFNIGGVTLSQVLAALRQQGYFYPSVFCSFCRYTRGIDKKHLTVEY